MSNYYNNEPFHKSKTNLFTSSVFSVRSSDLFSLFYSKSNGYLWPWMTAVNGNSSWYCGIGTTSHVSTPSSCSYCLPIGSVSDRSVAAFCALFVQLCRTSSSRRISYCRSAIGAQLCACVSTCVSGCMHAYLCIFS